MADDNIGVTVGGGQLQGVIGAGSVVIENLTFYSRAPDEPDTDAGEGEPIASCPYLGLAYFGPDDSALFFGRDLAIDRLTAAVTQQSFTGLLGSSGSGKSSVVLAGLAPRLYRMGGWRFGHFRIGNELDRNPFMALARALVPLFKAGVDDIHRLDNTKKLAAQLQANELTLRDVFSDRLARNKGGHILLIADQFEETFTLIEDETVRHHFIDVLLAGFPDPQSGGHPEISLILTMRADFYGRALLYRPLNDALQGHVENLGPMSREELREAIVQPAKNAQVSFDPGLVETLLDDVESKPGSLPLLQFALREMWRLQERRKITRKSYDEIGGVQGALARRAETIFAEMTANGANERMKADFQRLFSRLVTPGESQADTRRIADRRELGDEVWSLVQRLAGEANRLVVTNAPDPSHETAEVVHEALIRNWPMLKGWIDRDRAFLSWRGQIRSNVEVWSAEPSDDGSLLRGGMLAQASDWFARRGDDFSPAERGYIETSLALRQREEDQKEAARQAEIRNQQELAEAARKLAREQGRRAKIVMFSAIATVVAIVAVLIAFYLQGNLRAAVQNWLEAKQEAQATQLQEARTVSLLAHQATRRGDAMMGMLAALAVMPDAKEPGARAPSADAAMALLEAWSNDREIATMIGHTDTVVSAKFSPDGKRVVTASVDETARVWDVSGATPPVPPVVLSGHTQEVTNAEFSPDGEQVVTASVDHTARIWDAQSGAEIRSLKHADQVISASFSQDGKQVVTASLDHTARIWDAKSGAEIRLLQNLAQVISASFSQDGKQVVTASLDHTARVWDLSRPEKAPTILQGHTQAVVSASFSPDGKQLVTASLDCTARVWDLTRSDQKPKILQNLAPVLSASFSPDGKQVVTASLSHVAQVWDLTGPDPRPKPLPHPAFVLGAAFSPDGKYVVTASLDNTARVWDLSRPEKTPTAILQGHTLAVITASFSHDSNRVVTASQDKTARVWDLSGTAKAATVLRAHTAAVVSASFSQDGKQVVTASLDRTVRVWDLSGATPQPTTLPGHMGYAIGAKFSPDGTRVVTSSDNNNARVWDLSGAAPVPTMLSGHKLPVAGASFSPDSKRVVTASWDKTARLWDAQSGDQINVLRGHEGAVSRASFSPDGKRVVTASADKTARVWDAQSGAEIAKLSGHTEAVISASFSPDGKRVVTASSDETVRLWDAQSGAEIAELGEYEGWVTSAEFSRDGKRVAIASLGNSLYENPVRVWDLSGAAPVAIMLRGHKGSVFSASFSPDGNRVVTAGADSTVRVWDLSGAAPVASILSGHTYPVLSASFSRDGKYVVSASMDTTAIIHEVPPYDDLMEKARRSLTRCLTIAQQEELGLRVGAIARSDRTRIDSPPCNAERGGSRAAAAFDPSELSSGPQWGAVINKIDQIMGQTVAGLALPITGEFSGFSDDGWPIIGGTPVRLSGVEMIEPDKRDQFSSWIRSHDGKFECILSHGSTYRCLTANKLDVAEAVLLNGAARATPDADSKYREAEEQAKEQRRGVWQ